MNSVPASPPRWQPFVGHALTVAALALGGLSSFYALKAEVVELRATVHALVQTEAEHTRRGEAALRDACQRRAFEMQQIREDLKELRADLREIRSDLKNAAKKGAPP